MIKTCLLIVEIDERYIIRIYVQKGLALEMKYAKFVNRGNNDYMKRTRMLNLGDNIKSIAVNKLLSYSEIQQGDIIEVSYYNQSTITEPCCLIVNNHYNRQMNLDYMNNRFIRPIFIGWALMDSELLPEEVAYLKKYEPILCRDEFTKNVLTKYQVEAYIMGCLSLTFDKRVEDCERDKFYFVDVPEKFLKKLPNKIRENAVFTRQHIKLEHIDEGVMKDGEHLAHERLNEYCNNAKMIISPLLHCITPCLAMGIPVIAVGSNFSYRYGFIDAFVTSYNEKTFAEYNWEQKVKETDIEEIKHLILETGRSMIEGTPDYKSIKKLDDYYSKRTKWDYCYAMKKDLKDIFGDRDEPLFILWGASVGGHTVYNCIKELYPTSEMYSIVDSYAKGIWEGKEIREPETVIKGNPNVVVIVATVSGQNDARILMGSMNRREGVDYFMIHESMYS